MTATTTRRWDRAELATLVDDLLTTAAALEQWLSGGGIGDGDHPAPHPAPKSPPAPFLARHKSDLSASELARVLGISSNTVLQWCRIGILPGSYMVPGSRSPRGKWIVPLAEARVAAELASEIRTARPRATDRAVATVLSRRLRETHGVTLSRNALRNKAKVVQHLRGVSA